MARYVLPMMHGLPFSPYCLRNRIHHVQDGHGQNIAWSSTACSGYCTQERHAAICLNDTAHGETVYNRFNRWSKSGVISIIFNKLLSSIDAHGLVDWSATALERKNIPISPEIIAGVALAAVWHQNPSGYRRKWPPVNIVLSPGQAHESVRTTSSG